MKEKPESTLLNKLCAHPEIISWALGALLLNGVSLALLLKKIPFDMFFSDWSIAGLVLTAVIAITLLGYFAGMFIFWPFLRKKCSKLNGAPLKVGDYVLILAGSLKGTTAKVYEITIGQGGWELARLDLGKERSKKFKDIFEVYSVFKLRNN